MPVLVINAINLRDGGGVTHITELLKEVNIQNLPFDKIVVVGSTSTISQIPQRTWLITKTHSFLNKGFFYIQIWRFFYFHKFLKDNECSLLFDPGGGYLGRFRPFVTMCRNMLVFEEKERERYKYSWVYFRLKILSWVQLESFKKADGVIFISNYAKEYLTKLKILKTKKDTVIYHGVSKNFALPIKEQKDISQYNFQNPFKLLYVSIIDLYKHQLNVAIAIQKLRNVDKIPIEVFFIGPNYKPAYETLLKWKKNTNNDGVEIVGKTPHTQLVKYYQDCDAFIFASTCENMPNILMEAMMSGLPICCSDKAPMTEFLGERGFFFQAENSESIYKSVKNMLSNHIDRKEMAHLSKQHSEKFTWGQCSKQTFEFLSDVFLKFQGGGGND